MVDRLIKLPYKQPSKRSADSASEAKAVPNHNMTNTSPLRRLRLERGLSIQDVASAVGTHPGNLSKIERQARGASPALAERLAQYFGPELTELEILYPDRFSEAAA